jgi:hypothetical protein
MLRLYPVKPIIPINLESFLSVIAMPSLLSILALIIAMWSSASSVDFSNGRGMYFIVSTFERNSSMGLASFLSTRLKYSRSVSRFGKGEVYGQHFFFLFIGLEDFNTEFRLKESVLGLLFGRLLFHKISGTTESEYPNQGSIQRNGALIFVQIPKCGNPVNSK